MRRPLTAALPWRPPRGLLAGLDPSACEWMDRASCAETGPHPFFPPQGGDARYLITAAKAVCAGCPVAAQCLEYAMDYEARPDTEGRHGVFGGATAGERRDIARARRKAAA